MGCKIRSLMNVDQFAGYHTIRWDAKNDMGKSVGAGTYIYTLQAGEFRATKKNGVIEVIKFKSINSIIN